MNHDLISAEDMASLNKAFAERFRPQPPAPLNRDLLRLNAMRPRELTQRWRLSREARAVKCS